MIRPDWVDVSSRYGAPMGRRAAGQAGEWPIKLRLARVPFVDGDYDRGGAYWGGGRWTLPLWVAWGDGPEEQISRFTRAATRDEAKAAIREDFPGARFYR